MGKISQTVANKAAVEICVPLQKEIDKKKLECGKVMREILEKEVPAEIMKAWEKNKNWIQSVSYVNLQTHGFSYECVNLDKSIPRESHSSYYSIGKEDSVVMHKLVNERDDLQKKYKETVQTIENTLLTLGTHKRVEVEYPEAYPYVAETPTTNTALMLNLAPIRMMTCTLIPGCTTGATVEEPKKETVAPVKRSHKKKVAVK